MGWYSYIDIFINEIWNSIQYTLVGRRFGMGMANMDANISIGISDYRWSTDI